MLILIYAFFRLANSCSIKFQQLGIIKNTLEISLSTEESVFWKIKDELIDGELIKFRLEGDPHSLLFQLQQPNDVYEQIYFPYQINEIHKVKQFGKNDFWFQDYSVLGRQDSQSIIYTYNENGFSLIHLNDYCTDFDYLDIDNFVVLCLQNDYLKIQIVEKTGNILNQQIIPITERVQYNLAIGTRAKNKYVLVYSPAYATSTINLESIIYVFGIQEYTIQLTPYQLDKKHLSDLFQNILKYFSVLDVQFFSNQLYILDYKMGPILLIMDSKGNFTQAKRITTSDYYKEYYSFSIKYSAIEKIIIFGKNEDDLMAIKIFQNNRFIDYERILRDFEFQLGEAQVQITKDFYLLNSKSDLIIFNENQLVDILRLHNQTYIANSNMNAYLVVDVQELDFYELGSGILKVKPQAQSTENEKYLKLVEMTLSDKCYVDIIIRIYQNNDTELHTLYDQAFYEQTVYYYPPYPDVYYELPKMTNGPNAQQIVQLTDHQNTYQSQFQLYSELKITGILQVDENDIIFSLVNYNEGINQYLVQTEMLGTYFYECKLGDLEQVCTQKIVFYPLIQLTLENTRWISNGMFDSYLAIKTQDNHILSIYKVTQTTIQWTYQIKTSLQDEKQQIIDFAITSKYVYTMHPAMNEIQVHSIKQRKLIYKTQLFSDLEQLFISNIYNSNILFIKSKNQILVTHFLNELNLLDKITVTNQENVQIKLSVFESTLIIVYKINDQQGILEYAIHNLNSISYLRQLPLYDYNLTTYVQLGQNTYNTQIFVTAISNKTETTVILVYRTKEYYRDSLLTVVDLNIKTDKPLLFTIPESKFSILQYIIEDQLVSFIFFPLPRTYWSYIPKPDHYQQQLTMIQEEWNEYHDIKRQYYKEVSIIDMQLYLNWHQEEINLNIIQGQENTIILNDSWIQGQRINFKITCTLCTTDNDSGVIYLENQFKKSQRKISDKPVIDLINYDINTVILLLQKTGSNLSQHVQFLNNYATIVSEVELEIERDYSATKIYKLTNEIIVFLYQRYSSLNPFLQFYYCKNFQCLFKGRLQLVDQLIDIKYSKNILILLATNAQSLPTLYFYNLNLEQDFMIKKLDLVINENYFHHNFNATAIDIREENFITLYISEFNLGLVIIEIQIQEENIKVLNYQFMELNFSQVGLVRPQSNHFINIQIYKIMGNICYVILVDQINETYLLQVSKTLKIVQVFQKLGNVPKQAQIGMVDSYLLQIYRIELKNYYCLYTIQVNEDVTKNAAICRAGVKLNDQTYAYNFLFRKSNFEKYELLINYYSYEDTVVLYILSPYPKIVIQNTTNLENYRFNLIAINPYEQSKISLKFNIIPPSTSDDGMTTLFVLLIVVFSVCVIGFIACVLLQMYLNKHRKRRRSYKPIQ